MTYTKEQLKRMSDNEINLAVTEKLENIHGETLLHSIEPCESWDDVMAIAEKYRILISAGHNAAMKFRMFTPCIKANSTTTKRAICEVFLMMEIEK